MLEDFKSVFGQFSVPIPLEELTTLPQIPESDWVGTPIPLSI